MSAIAYMVRRKIVDLQPITAQDLRALGNEAAINYNPIRAES